MYYFKKEVHLLLIRQQHLQIRLQLTPSPDFHVFGTKQEFGGQLGVTSSPLPPSFAPYDGNGVRGRCPSEARGSRFSPPRPKPCRPASSLARSLAALRQRCPTPALLLPRRTRRGSRRSNFICTSADSGSMPGEAAPDTRGPLGAASPLLSAACRPAAHLRRRPAAST